MDDDSWLPSFLYDDAETDVVTRIDVDDIVEQIEPTLKNTEYDTIADGLIDDDCIYVEGFVSKSKLTAAIKEAIEEQTEFVEVESKQMLREAVEKKYDYLQPDDDWDEFDDVSK